MNTSFAALTSSLIDEFTVCPAGGVVWWLVTPTVLCLNNIKAKIRGSRLILPHVIRLIDEKYTNYKNDWDNRWTQVYVSNSDSATDELVH